MKDSHTKIRIKHYTESENSNQKIKVKSTSYPDVKLSFEEWCRELHISRLYNREDCWLENNFFKNKNIQNDIKKQSI